jgi:hypothetical protein
MSKDALVQRLITFLKKSDALEYDRRTQRRNVYDDYEAPAPQTPPRSEVAVQPIIPGYHSFPAPDAPTPSENRQLPSHAGQASRLDAVVMRAVQQFNAQVGYVIRYKEGHMRYCTGRDVRGHYVPHTAVDPDRRAVFLALDSGESQLFVHTLEDNTPVAILCGPLRVKDKVIGVLYLDNPARSRLHRGIFDVFCDQAARMLSENVV